ncbi:transcriptional regulator [Blastomonas sp.]|uniref:transcriptional regulator n=1 Tax=Blastomonas sp. TaxID=1909299 RepID=UPI00391C0E2B
MAIHDHLDSPLAKVCIALGGQSALARLIGKDQSTVHDRLRNNMPIWAEHVLAIEAATGISRHDLRPDIYPVEAGASPVSPVSHPQGTKIPEGRTSSLPDADLDPVEASKTVAGGEAAQSEDDPGCAADTPESAPPIGKAAA